MGTILALIFIIFFLLQVMAIEHHLSKIARAFEAWEKSQPPAEPEEES